MFAGARCACAEGEAASIGWTSQVGGGPAIVIRLEARGS